MKTNRNGLMGYVTPGVGLAWRTLLFVLYAAAAVPAQQDTIPQRGFHPAGSYALTDLETINTANGNVMFRIPLVSLPPGRGGTPGPAVSLYYNSKLWDTFEWIDSSDPRFPAQYRTEVLHSPDGGWRYALNYELRLDDRLTHFHGAGLLNCTEPGADYIWKLEMSFPDGTVREFRPRGFSDSFGEGYFNIAPDGSRACGAGVTSAMTYYSADASYLKLVIEHDTDSVWSNNPWTLYLPDGSRVTGGNAPQRVYDRNNNFSEFRNITYNAHPATQVVDQLGRFLIIEYQSAPGQDSVYIWGVNNEQMRWTVRWRSTWIDKLYFPDDSRTYTWSLDTGATVIDQISLPVQAGTLAYAFDYNPAASAGWGELSLVRLPSGAEATYQYRNDGTNSLPWRDVIDNVPIRKDLTYLRDYDGASAPATETWLYSGGTWVSREFTITSQDGGVLRNHFDRGGWVDGLIYKNEHPDGRLVERLWNRNVPFGVVNYNFAANPYVKTEFTSVRDALGNLAKTAIKDFSYDKNGNLTRLAEYDWAPYSTVPRDAKGRPTGIPAGAKLQKLTLNTYYNPTPDASSTVDHVNAYYNPGSPPLRAAIESTEVRGELGQTLSRTESFYDNPSTTGNLTQERRWDSTKGVLTRPLNLTNAVAVAHEYSASGNRILTTDARGARTQFIYGVINGFSDLYVTQTKTAYQTSVQRTTNLQYDFSTGLVSLQADGDNNVTTRTSYDVFGRSTLIQEAYLTALERRTATEYSDTGRRVIVRRDLNTTGDGKLVAVQHYDPLGRIRLRRHLENATLESAYDEATGIKVQTRYAFAAPNRFDLVSNPYRAASSGGSGGESTMGWTRTMIDVGGRIVEVQTFAGATLPYPWGPNTNSTGPVRTSYDADATTVTDQAGKSRRSVRDALGRLSSVTEDPAGLAHLTTYQYNALDNLTTVRQGGQTRSFAYDSVGRLASATNPESGTVTYRHDGNGNVTLRSEARGQITYVYDPLNRLTSRSYTDGTPLVTLVYDAPAVIHSKGRLTSVSSTVSSYGYDEYDALGRVKRSSQVTGGNQYVFSYAYNLAGGMTAQSYPSGRIITTGYDAAGRISSVTGQKAGEAGKTYVSSLAYASHGPVKSVRLGNGLWEHTNFNNRLQPIQIGLGTTSTSSSVLSLDYSYGTTNNNGNVLGQTITATGFSKPQSYSYDGLNRLQQADELGSWTQTYGYDRYGNRSVNPGSYMPDPTLTPQSQSAFDANNNRLLGGQYDSAGNQTQDGAGNTYSYDLENRQTGHNGTTTYHYDGEGRRVKKVEAVGATVFVYNGAGQLVHERSDLPPSGTSGTSYLTADHLGSTRLITDAAGGVKKRYDYLPFGEEIPSSIGGRSSVPGYPAGDSTRQRFTGKERDAESGLDYFGARYMSAAQGRSLSPDQPLADQWVEDPQSWNLYPYVRNSPLKYVDEDGEAVTLATAAGGAAMGFIIGSGGEIFSQWRAGKGYDWQKIGAKGAGAAVFGFGIGLTGGATLVATVFTGATASAAGGLLERALDGDADTELFDEAEIASDIASGFIAGGVGHQVQALLRAKLPVPEWAKLRIREARRLRRISQGQRQYTRPVSAATLTERAARNQQFVENVLYIWPSSVARGVAKKGTKEAVTVTFRYLGEDELRKLRGQER